MPPIHQVFCTFPPLAAEEKYYETDNESYLLINVMKRHIKIFTDGQVSVDLRCLFFALGLGKVATLKDNSFTV